MTDARKIAERIEAVAAELHEQYRALARTLGWPIKASVDVPYQQLEADVKEFFCMFARWHLVHLADAERRAEEAQEEVKALASRKVTDEAPYSEIAAERTRQVLLKAAGKFRTTASDNISNGDRLAILLEEVGEVARAINEQNGAQTSDPVSIRKELIQVAAVAVAWLEGLARAFRGEEAP